MRKLDVRRMALVVLLGCAVRAPGRDVPVYREYVVPIAFYDERGDAVAFDAVAPDLAAIRSLRDARSREALMGKETALPMSFQRGASVFGAQASLPGKMSPPSGGQESRRSQDDSERNWLAKSLSLPTLGQTTSNAAISAMSAPEEDSGWGWLAADVSGSAGAEGFLPEELLLDTDESNPLAAQGDAAGDPSNPFRKGRSAADREKDGTAPADSGGFPKDRIDRDPDLPDRLSAGGESLRRDPKAPVAAADDFTAPKSYRASAGGVAEMSQTRKILADFSAGSRPDFSSFRESLAGVSAGENAGRSGLGLDRPLRAESSFGREGQGRPASLGFSRGQDASWKGGWNLSGSGSGLVRPDLPASTPIPAPAPAATRPVFSSGGTKPGWY